MITFIIQLCGSRQRPSHDKYFNWIKGSSGTMTCEKGLWFSALVDDSKSDHVKENITTSITLYTNIIDGNID